MSSLFKNYVNIKEDEITALALTVDKQASYDNIITKWHPEIRHHCPQTPYILVGTKTDLRNSKDLPEGIHLVSKNMGRKMATKIKAEKYVECSAKTMEGINEVFQEAVRAVLNPKSNLGIRVPRNCSLL